MSNHSHNAPEEIALLAADPNTDWDTLHWIAENCPQLRAVVAANPGTYQELVEALAAMGDPEIDAAIAQREEPAGGELSSWEASTSPLAGMYESASEQDTDADLDVVGEPLPLPSQQTHRENERHRVHGQKESAPHPEQGAPAPPVPMPAQPGAAEGRASRRGGAGLLIIGAAALVVLLGMGALLWNLLAPGGDPVAEPEPVPQQTEEAPEQPEEQDGEETAEEPSVDVAQARADVEDLPEESSCDASSQDAGLVAAFVQAADDYDQWDGDIDADLLEDTFEGLQANCSSTYAAEVYEELRSGDEADETVTASVEAVGTEWVDQVMAADGAQEMEGFVTPDENIYCVFEDGVTCTALQQTNAAPAGCNGGATFTMDVSGETGVDCDNEVSPDDDRSTLSYDSTATDGFLACVSLEDRVSCWNTLTGAGFEISERDHYSYSY